MRPAREAKEETGLDMPVGDLLVLDYVPDHPWFERTLAGFTR